MDRTEYSRDASVTDLSGVRGSADDEAKPEIEPDSWRELTEFADRFDDAVFSVLAEPDDSPEGFWIAEDIDKVRPAAVPLGDPPTFDISVLGPDGTAIGEIRLTIEEIEHVRAAEPSGVSPETDEV
ncbi:hypothetical protein [Natranaeroarchaeum sulfidigenes]|uniref:Uncharacterized protein n=1 Tax=Natranaeroarchaeum sulfidigenes TaxID=2784880 RepID=A0A897MT91_9EURY|nr:hypothetical protein [Natranaeroarchaeum sulfidigenes]QSG03511.1 hypothetical protein AArcS_2315 [Natranaeroarchaeum sulfidigenes]